MIPGNGWRLTLREAPEWALELQESEPAALLVGACGALLEAQHQAETGWAAVPGTQQLDLRANYTWRCADADCRLANTTDGGVALVLDGAPRDACWPALGVEFRAYPDAPPHADALALRIVFTVRAYAWQSPLSAALALVHAFALDGRPVDAPAAGNAVGFGDAGFAARAQARLGDNTTVGVALWRFHASYWQLHERFAEGATLAAEDVVHVLEPRTLSSGASGGPPSPCSASAPSSKGGDGDDDIVLIVSIVVAVAIIAGGFLGGVLWYRHTHSITFRYSIA